MLCASYHTKHLTLIKSFHLPNSREVGTLTISIFIERKLRHRLQNLPISPIRRQRGFGTLTLLLQESVCLAPMLGRLITSIATFFLASVLASVCMISSSNLTTTLWG